MNLQSYFPPGLVYRSWRVVDSIIDYHREEGVSTLWGIYDPRKFILVRKIRTALMIQGLSQKELLHRVNLI